MFVHSYMYKFLFIILISSFLLSETYIFNENIRITETSNNQKFPEIAIDENIIHLSWVSINGGNKNIMYSKSEDYGESFSAPIQVNYLNNNIIAYGGQSGPRVAVYQNKVYITYTDDRSGLTAIYLNISGDYGNTWQEEILISDTQYLNAYQDFEIDINGNLHLVYYNYAANYHLQDVRYRFFEAGDIIYFNPSILLGIVTDDMEPCDCCQPDLEIDQNGDVYVIYRNNLQNIRDAYLAVKRYSNNVFSEYYQVSDTQDYIGFCPSSGPSLTIDNEGIAVSYTSYNDENAYISLSTLDDLDFSDYLSLNPSSNTFQNYPYILLDDNIHAVWVEQDGWDIYYGMRDIESGTMMNIQKINNDNTNSTQEDPIIYKQDDFLYSFWADNRNGNYEIYFSQALNESILPGDINQDDFIDILDIVIMVNIILGQYQPDTQEIIASDLNNDNLINIQDIILLINIILNN